MGEAEYAIEKLTERLEYVFEFQRGVEGWAFLLMLIMKNKCQKE